MGVEGVASHHGVDENGGGLLEKCLADRQFTVVFFTTVAVHGERCPGGIGEAKASAGEIGAASPFGNDEAAELNDELETVGAGHGILTDRGVGA